MPQGICCGAQLEQSFKSFLKTYWKLVLSVLVCLHHSNLRSVPHFSDADISCWCLGKRGIYWMPVGIDLNHVDPVI